MRAPSERVELLRCRLKPRLAILAGALLASMASAVEAPAKSACSAEIAFRGATTVCGLLGVRLRGLRDHDAFPFYGRRGESVELARRDGSRSRGRLVRTRVGRPRTAAALSRSAPLGAVGVQRRADSGGAAFLDRIGQIDTNGFPPESDPAPAAAASEPPDYFRTVCVACHAVGGVGGSAGPALDGVGSRLSVKELDQWLADPPAIKPGTPMPNMQLPDDIRAELVQWLATLK